MIKWEGDTDIVHGLEPFAHLDPVLKAWALDARFVEPMCDFVGDANPSLFTEKLNLKRPGIGGVNPMHQDYPYWIGEAKDPGARGNGDAVPRRRDARKRLSAGCPGQPPLGTVAQSDRFRRVRRQRNRPIGLCRRRDAAAAAESGFHGDVRLFAGAQLRTESIRSSQRRALLFSYQPAGHPTMVER